MTMGVLIWCAVAAMFLLLELGSPGLFFCLSLCFGALAAAPVAWATTDLVAQGVAFLVGTAIAFLILKRWVEQELHHGHRTNVHALQGRRGVVVADITAHQAGMVKLGGEVWSALSAHNDAIPAQTLVEVVRVRGTHLIVVVDSTTK